MNRKQTLAWIERKRAEREWLSSSYKYWHKAELLLWCLK